MSALLDRVDAHPIGAPTAWTGELAERRARNDAAMRERLARGSAPDAVSQRAARGSRCAATASGVYLVNEGANALDITRNVIDMRLPRHRLDSGTWGVMGIGMGYAIAARSKPGNRGGDRG